MVLTRLNQEFLYLARKALGAFLSGLKVVSDDTESSPDVIFPVRASEHIPVRHIPVCATPGSDFKD